VYVSRRLVGVTVTRHPGQAAQDQLCSESGGRRTTTNIQLAPERAQISRRIKTRQTLPAPCTQSRCPVGSCSSCPKPAREKAHLTWMIEQRKSVLFLASRALAPPGFLRIRRRPENLVWSRVARSVRFVVTSPTLRYGLSAFHVSSPS